MHSKGRNNMCWCAIFLAALATVSANNQNNYLNSDVNPDRLQEIQNRILDIVGNTTGNLYTMTDVVGVLNTDAGKEIGKLLLEGVPLGFKQKNSARLIGQFWPQLYDRLSPTLQDTVDDYKDFFKGIDISTLPLMWDQLFQKDQLGNSLAGMPLGQLVDMVQPTASKYGIDLRAMMNSLMGKGDNNIRDLVFSVLKNADISSLMNHIINTTANALQVSDTSKDSGSNTQNEGNHKKGKADKTLRLFRPFVASLLRDNEIDLDADAVLEVISPLFKSDFIAQATPWLAMLAGQGSNGGLGSLIGNLMGGGKDGFNQNQMAGLIGGLGSLMAAGGGGNQMDIGSLVNMASMFMGNPTKKKRNNKNKSNKKMKETDEGDLDLGTLMNVAGQLIGNNINLDTVLDFASKSLQPKDKKKATKVNEPKRREKVTEQENINTAPKSKPKSSKKTSKKSKTIVNMIEPILQSMKNDKKCNAKIKDAIDLGKTLFMSKISALGNLNDILPLLISYFADSDALSANGVKLQELTKTFTQNFAKADWSEFLVSLENKDFRQVLIRNIAPNAAELVTLLATTETQDKIYDSIVPRIQNLLASYGLVGVTLDNFPERLAPMLGLLGKGWNLPFNPTTLLVPLKVYLKSLKSWVFSGLQELSTLSSEEMQKRVIEVLDEDVSESIVNVMQILRTTSDLDCLPQRLCQVNSALDHDSLEAAVTRVTSLALSTGPVLSTSDTHLLLQTVRAISGSSEDCEVTFPGDCDLQEEDDEEDDEDDSLSMDLLYEHQEL